MPRGKPPFFLPSWTAMYVVNIFVVVWVTVVGFGFGGWASMANLIKQVDTFGLCQNGKTNTDHPSLKFKCGRNKEPQLVCNLCMETVGVVVFQYVMFV
ncbi:hypothetical protein Leryth_021079 [Lithospermum erythrorhizon]|nr:hypothetical protein Leryth_021079 [Lithospermum erythrorhizon]